MVCHSDEIPPRYWFLFNWSAAFAPCVLKLRYNQNCPFLVVGNPNQKKMHIFGFVGIFEYICKTTFNIIFCMCTES